ncbi:MAG: hypothetical protein AAB583_03650 [Patescibacteria group bacterium]
MIVYHTTIIFGEIMSLKIKIFDKILKKLENSRIYAVANNYNYFVYPYKGVLPIDITELNYIGKLIAKNINPDVDLLFTFEVDGIYITQDVASKLGKDFLVARSFHYNLKEYNSIMQKTGYYEREMFFSFDKIKIKKIAIIDCVLSTGRTIKASLDFFKKQGIEVEGVYVVVNKCNYHSDTLIKNLGTKFFALFDLEIKKDKILVNKSKYNQRKIK